MFVFMLGSHAVISSDALHKKSGKRTSLCNLCVLCVSVVDEVQAKTHHRDTEHTEVAQRNLRRTTFCAKQSSDRKMRSSLACLLILALLPALTVAGQSGFDPQNDGAEQWRAKSETLTDDLLKDAGQLSSSRRAVLLARLAQRWWPDDQGRARKWFQNAIELLEQPSKETPDERLNRIAAARIVLQNVARLDQKLTSSLVKILTPRGQVTDRERTESADWLITSATDLIAVDTKRANELAGAALPVGPPNDIAPFLVALRGKDPQLADGMFTHALSLAKQQSYPMQLLNSLNYAAFPVLRNYGRATTPIPPENLRVELLQTEINFLNANAINDDNQGSMCSCVTGFIAPMASEFDRLLPAESEVVRQAITKCESLTPVREQLSSAEDFLRAATGEKHDGVRTRYELRAATSAKQAKDYDLAFRILDGMTKEQREIMGSTWESTRWSWATEGALDYYREGRLAEMTLILNAVPANLQPIAKISFLGRVGEPKDAEPAPLIQILNEALIEMRRSNMPELDKYNWYMAVLQSTVKYQPADASGVLKPAVSSLNRAKDRKTIETADFADGMAEPLLAMEEYVVKDSIAAMTLVELRANLRLVLLTATI